MKNYLKVLRHTERKDGRKEERRERRIHKEKKGMRKERRKKGSIVIGHYSTRGAT